VSQETRAARRSATFGEVFASREFRAIYTASALSWIGDYITRAAVTALVYAQTRSVTSSAAAFAISFLPWIVGGPVLAALAERYRHRTVMIVCDLARAVLVATIALLHLPIPVMLVLLFSVALLKPPFEAARSALMPRVLDGERYVLGLAMNVSTSQAAQIIGYLAGSAIGAVYPRLALLFDAGTFVVSALLARFGVRARPPVLTRAQRKHLLRETAQGFRVVFGTPVLRAIAVTVLAANLFTVPPEGLAAAWAGLLERDNPHARGLAQGMIMIATPLGWVLASVLINRFLAPDLRRRLIRPFAVLAPVTLVPALFNPPAPVVALLATLCGVCVAGLVPTSNGLFVQALPRQYRARANGVMVSGLQVIQGGAVMLTGALATRFPLPVVVGLWSLGGVLLMVLVSAGWPAPSEFESTIERTRLANLAAEAAEDGAAPGPGVVEPAEPKSGVPLPSGGIRTAESY
jgi:MFS family permease